MRYVIETGDTLNRIAQRYGVSTEDIQNANAQITNPHIIIAGDALTIPLPNGALLDEPEWLTFAYEEMEQDEAYARLKKPNPHIALYRQSLAPRPPANSTWNTGFAQWCLEQADKPGAGTLDVAAWQHWGRPVETPWLGCVLLYGLQAEDVPRWMGFFVDEVDAVVEIIAGDVSGRIQVVPVPKVQVVACRWPSPFPESFPETSTNS